MSWREEELQRKTIEISIDEERKDLANLMRALIWFGFLGGLMQVVVVIKQSGNLDEAVHAECSAGAGSQIEDHTRRAPPSDRLGAFQSTDTPRGHLGRVYDCLHGVTGRLAEATEEQREAHHHHPCVVEVRQRIHEPTQRHQSAHQTDPEIPLQKVKTVDHRFLLAGAFSWEERAAGVRAPVAQPRSYSPLQEM